MPELPEVETIRLGLLEKIAGKKIKEVEILDPKVINLEVADFQKQTKEAVIDDIKRRAKLLILNLSNEKTILIHLKLTGQLIYEASDEKYARAIFKFNDRTKLVFKDFRRFGFIKLIPTLKVEDYLRQEQYGPEPLGEEFNLETFRNLLKTKPRAKIKPLLMDQTFIAGIGNIYSDEALFYAGLHPLRKVATLTTEEIEKLYQGIREILAKATDKRGSSVDAYLDIEGKEGEYIPFLKVYRREGQKCFRCGAKVESIKIGGRSTHFCPNCQK